MKVSCSSCLRTLEYMGERPLFCAYCGQRLSQSVDPEAVTLGLPPRSTPVSTITYHPAVSQESTLPPPGAHQSSLLDDVPQTIGGYRLLRRIGKGGMGTVYEAEALTNGQRVALKLIGSEYAANQEAVERFRQEGRLASMIAHPRCVFVLAADEDQGRPYIVMELMPGTTLHDLVKQGPMQPEQAVAKILDVIEGLQEAHQLGVIHRDVKPSNCFLDADGRVKIGDFGLSKSLVGGTDLTRPGAFLGTPLFASPEQIRGEPADAQSDIYSLAATLYCLLVGKAPFQSDDAAAVIARIVTEDPPSMRLARPEFASSLDEVVLKGLQRDKTKRWKNLEEFRQALLPFAPGQHSLAELGLRFGAALLDLGLVLLISLIGAGLLELLDWVAGERFTVPLLVPFLLGLLLRIGYFGLLEGRWGWSLGKRAFGLRVCRVGNNDRPGLARGLGRAAAFIGLLNLGTLTWFVLHPGDLLRLHGIAGYLASFSFTSVKFMVEFSFLPLIGLGLMVCTMRKQNGYRGLHEIISGTHVILLPLPRKARKLRCRTAALPQIQAAELPERLGSFAVKGRLGLAPIGQMLLGEDESLKRQVWLWLRPVETPDLLPARRTLSRTTRPRWLAGGYYRDQEWDAFLAPAGCPLNNVVDRRHRLDWADTRMLLEQLTEELVAAEDDGTLPGSLSVSQVWVQPSGRLQLVDIRWDQGTDTKVVLTPQQRALHLLRDVALLALEGTVRPVVDRARARVYAPLPEYAAEFLRRLLRGSYTDVRAFRDDLRQARHNPDEVSRARRAMHVGLLGALQLPGLITMLIVSVLFLAANLIVAEDNALRSEVARDYLDEVVLARQVFAASPLAPAERARQLGELALDLSFRQHLSAQAARNNDYLVSLLASTSRPVQGIERLVRQNERENLAEQMRERLFAFPGEYRETMLYTLRRSQTFSQAALNALLQPQWWALFVWPVIWVAWAFATRGGLSYPLTGLALVRGDGRQAGRLQCAWRALLVWAPVTALLALSMALDAHRITPPVSHVAAIPMLGPWLAWLAWWSSLVVLGVYVFLALRFPNRGPHDRLAGTYLVPK